MPETRRTDPDREAESNRREAGFWLVLGLVQGAMAASIGVWLLVKGDVRFGALALVSSVLILAGLRWKRARLAASND
ncbi:MAG: hypothetical protein H7268_06780 [Sandarakinorhabdus sp.]|nr:hypothetical protein [Sandarakinorhabdus sp.]